MKAFKIAALAAVMLLCVPAFSQQAQIITSEETATEEFPEFDPTIAAENGYSVQQDANGEYRVKGSAGFTFDAIKDMLLHFFFNLLISWIIVHFFYYRRGGRKNYYFTFLIFSSAMFILLFVMNNLSLQIGFTLGLFAIFGMIRYRTETVPVREMTYLFIIIAISIINGIGAEVPFAQLVVANVVMIALIWVLEALKLGGRTSTKVILYDRIELITPEHREELIADIEKRIGIKVESVEVGSVDFLRDSAYLKVTYKLGPDETNDIDNAIKVKTYENS